MVGDPVVDERRRKDAGYRLPLRGVQAYQGDPERPRRQDREGDRGDGYNEGGGSAENKEGRFPSPRFRRSSIYGFSHAGSIRRAFCAVNESIWMDVHE